jgi:hypothetical protein
VVVIATDNVGVESVELYIDDNLREVDYEPPYIWVWDEQSMLCLFELKVVALDYAGNKAVDMRKVWRVSLRTPNHF